ncbi:MAG TPA: hypothetical protein VKP67_12805, partial [Xanthobacteraceae bacterium]|nr:hypothetical protein [Xanthobacteraceae bacterium]
PAGLSIVYPDGMGGLGLDNSFVSHRRSSRPQRGVRKIELDGEATEALRAVIADHDRKSVSAALMNAARLYLELREDEPPKVITSGMPDLLVSLLATE